MPSPVTDEEFLAMFDTGLTQYQVARELGVSRQAVSKRLIRLRGVSTKIIMARNTEPLVKHQFNAAQQLQDINAKALALLDKAEADEDKEFNLKVLGELRQQLKLAADIQMQLYSAEEARRFMHLLTDILREVDEGAYKRFTKRLHDEAALRGLLQSPRP